MLQVCLDPNSTSNLKLRHIAQLFPTVLEKRDRSLAITFEYRFHFDDDALRGEAGEDLSFLVENEKKIVISKEKAVYYYDGPFLHNFQPLSR